MTLGHMPYIGLLDTVNLRTVFLVVVSLSILLYYVWNRQTRKTVSFKLNLLETRLLTCQRKTSDMQRVWDAKHYLE